MDTHWVGVGPDPLSLTLALCVYFLSQKELIVWTD